MSAYSRVTYTGTGSVFNASFSFPYLNPSDIYVFVNGVSVPFTFLNTSTVTPTAVPAAGATIQVRRATQKTTSPVNFTDGSVLLERDLDLLSTYSLYLAQEADDAVTSSITLNTSNLFDAQSSRIINLANPVAATDAVNRQYFESVYTPLLDAKVTSVAASATTATTQAGIAAVQAAASAASAALSIANSANVTTVAGIASNVTTVAGISANVTAVANNATNVNAAVANAANINSAVSNATNINAAVTNATNITTVAGIAANVTTVAGISTDVTAVKNNAANVTAVAGISGNVTTVAGNTSNINAAVANAANINSAVTNATNINSVVANAANINTVAGINAAVTTVAGISAAVSAVNSNATNINAVNANSSNINTAVANLAALTGKVGQTSSTGSAQLPTGTQAQRDASPIAGSLRFNSDVNKPEVYNGTSWGSVGGGATGGGSDEVFVQNSQAVTSNYTIPVGKNASAVGPISVPNGVSITVSSGSRWVVL